MAELKHLTNITGLPLSSNQKRLWIVSQLDKLNPAYNIQLAYHFEDHVDIDILRKSLAVLFARQHTIFSVFKNNNGIPYIELVPRQVEIELKDFKDVPAGLRKDKLLDFAGEEARIPFDLETGPLYRLYLLKESEKSWYFYAVINHLIFDGFSRRLFARELSDIYTSRCNGSNDAAEPLSFYSYDFAELEKVPMPSEKEKELIEFWKGNLKDLQPELNFPYDFPRRNEPTGLGFREPFEISPECTAKLRGISREMNTSVFNTLLTSFGLMLQKYSGEDDICIGIPVSNRRSYPSFRTFGLMVNTVPVRLNIEGDKKFKVLIEQTTGVVTKAIANSALTFDKIVESVNPARRIGINPFFQVSFSWINNLTNPMDLGGVQGKRITVNKGISPFDLTFYMWENGDHLEGEIEYNSDILKTETIIRLKRHFIRLVENLTEKAEIPISSLSLISGEEIELIRTVNDTSKGYSKDKTMLDLFEDRVSLEPGNISIISDGGQLTYSELDHKATQLASVLRFCNVRHGDFVGLLMRRSPELITCLLALYKLGAAYIPLNLTDPDNRIMSIIDTAKIKFVITNSDNAIDLSAKCEKQFIEDLIGKSEGNISDPVEIEASSEDPAYVIFTSGTTGTPKGVLVNHKSAINLIEWVNKTFQISKTDKLLWVTNLSFDLSVYDIFGILAAGGIIRIVSEEDRTNPEKQFRIMLEEGITFWDSAPQSIQQLVPYFGTASDNGLNKSLRLVFLSGDWIPLSLPPAITGAFPQAVVTGLGGATEATVWSNYFVIDEINPGWKSVPYGKPIQNARYYVLDNELNHCRINQPGNLYIGGECLASGYFNDPVLSDKKFVTDPYNTGGKMYLTGDKAQWMPDGNIEFLGREDEQLKVRGYRVEIGEIKNVVLQNKLIRDAIVIPDKSDRYDIKVILFILTHNNKDIDVRDLKREFRASLPEYMIPADIVRCDEFPATANGKINSKELLATYLKSVSDTLKKSNEKGSPDESGQLNPTEKAVYRIWNGILPSKVFTAADNFFDIGGNSLLAIRVINKIREEFGYVLTFRAFLSNPTISQLAGLLKDYFRSDQKEINLLHLSSLKGLPLTKNQKRLWLIWKMDPGKVCYIISFTYRFSGKLNTEILQQSFDILFKRHHVIFSVIKTADAEPYIDIEPKPVKISFFDISQLAENDKPTRVDEIFNTDACKAFNLEDGPLYRLILVKTGNEEYNLRLCIHHIIFDGWSWSVLVKDLNEIYNCLLEGRGIKLPPLEFQQYDYALWEKNNTGSDDSPDLKEFWRSYLKDCSPVINFPYDFPRRERPTGKGRHEDFIFGQDVTDKLKHLSRNEGSSLFTTLLTVFSVQMQKYSGEDDINIGLPLSYRPHSKLENIFGMFVNTVVIRVISEKNLTIKDLIRRTDTAAYNAIAHQELPFESMVKIVNPDRISNVNPLFQVAFAWQHTLDKPLSLNGVRSERIAAKERCSNFDLTMVMWEDGNQILGEIEYNTDILTRETITRFRDNFIFLVNSLIENPDQQFSEISVVSESERKKLAEINNTYVPVPECLMQDFFVRQAKERPLKTAVISGKKEITYKDLDQRANQLAHYLISYGVKQGDAVGVCIERSVEMIIAVLGILKAGGCYLPLDPDFPDDRRAFMFNDSGAAILITQSSLKNKISIFSESCIVFMDSDHETLSNYSTDNPAIITDVQSPAYIIYTSGSTGKPKGVKVLHRGMTNWIQCMSRVHGADESDALLALATPSFDMSVLEIFLSVSNGATLIVPGALEVRDGLSIMGLLEKYNVTFLAATPSYWRILFSFGWKGKSNLKAITGGEALTSDLVNRLLPVVAELWNYYGPTETTICSTGTRVMDARSRITVGKPMDNTQVYILDTFNKLLPMGVTGELAIGGAGVAAGYLNRPELTSEKFIEFGDSGIIYKTGDMARLLADGNIELLGRIDNQVKLRGYRIELGEIESRLVNIPGIRDAVVKVHQFAENDERLVGFLNVDPEFSMKKDEISGILLKSLNSYMVPSFFQFSEGFPTLPNGKVNRKALVFKADEHADAVNTGSKHVQITNDIEKSLFTLWKELLKTDNMSVTDNFFDIGGNSLLAIELSNIISRKFDIPQKALFVFEHPTIKGQSIYMSCLKQNTFSHNESNVDERMRSKKNINFKKLRG